MKKTFVILTALLLVACCATALAAGPSATIDNIFNSGLTIRRVGAEIINVTTSEETQETIDNVVEFLEEGHGKILDYIARRYGQSVADECAASFGMSFEEAREVVYAKEIFTVAKVGDLSLPVSIQQITTIVSNWIGEPITGVAAHQDVGRHVELDVVDEYLVEGYVDVAIQDFVSDGKTFTLFILGVPEGMGLSSGVPTHGNGAAIINVTTSKETQETIDEVVEFLAADENNRILDYIAGRYGQPVADDCAKAFDMTFEEAREALSAKYIFTMDKVGDHSIPVSIEQITTETTNEIGEPVLGVAAHDNTGRHVELEVMEEYYMEGYVDEDIQDYVTAGKTFTLFILGYPEQ